MHELKTLLYLFVQVQIQVISAGRVRHMWWQLSLVAVSFLHSRSRRLCFVSVRFLLSTFQSLISQTWLDRYWPDLVTSTGWPSHLCHMTRLWSKVTYGSQGSERSFSIKKKFQVQQGIKGSFQVLTLVLPRGVTVSWHRWNKYAKRLKTLTHEYVAPLARAHQL